MRRASPTGRSPHASAPRRERSASGAAASSNSAFRGLNDEFRPGRPRSYDDEKIAGLIHRALRDKPVHAANWSVRLLGGAEGVSKSTVQRWFSLFGVKPHLAQTSQLSNDPIFLEKVRDIVGLYLDPPDHARVL